MEENEHWHPVRWKPDYLVSDEGAVWNIRRDEEVSQWLNANGRFEVSIDGETRLVHHLVAEAFLPTRYMRGAHVVHIDGDVTNNSLENLQWKKKL